MDISTGSLLPVLKRAALLLIGILVAVGILGYVYQYTTNSRASADSTVNFFFAQNSITSDVSKPFSVDLEALSPNPVSIATILLRYPRDLIRFDETQTKTEMAECEGLETDIDLQVLESTGQESNTIVITRGSFKSDEELPRDVFCAARLYFTGLKEGTGTITYEPIDPAIQNKSWDVAGPGAVLAPALSGDYQQITVAIRNSSIQRRISDTSPQSSPPMVTSGTTNIPQSLQGDNSSVSVTMKVKLQGVSSQPANSSEVPIQVSLVKNDTVQDTQTIPFASQPDGSYQARFVYEGLPPSDEYAFLLKGQKHLQKRICDESPTELVEGSYECEGSRITLSVGENVLDFQSILLVAGDTPLQNGVVDAADIGYIRNNIGQRGEEKIARGDLNYDGVIDTQDYTLIINSLKYKYDE